MTRTYENVPSHVRAEEDLQRMPSPEVEPLPYNNSHEVTKARDYEDMQWQQPPWVEPLRCNYLNELLDGYDSLP